MANRYYDRELDCGCLISNDERGGGIDCFAETEEEITKHQKAWSKWMKTDDFKKHNEEVIERNQ